MLNGDVVIRRKRFRRRGSKGGNSKKRREKSPMSGKSHRPLSVRDVKERRVSYHQQFYLFISSFIQLLAVLFNYQQFPPYISSFHISVPFVAWKYIDQRHRYISLQLIFFSQFCNFYIIIVISFVNFQVSDSY